MANSKLIFSVETSSNVCGVAAIDGNEILSSVEKSIPRKHAEILPISKNLWTIDLRFESIEGI